MTKSVHRYRFSPFQLVIGKENRLNALQDNNHAAKRGNRLEAMVDSFFETRIKILKTESEERIKAALKKQSTINGESTVVDSIVSYFRNGTKSEKDWKGPAQVIGMDNSTIFI